MLVLAINPGSTSTKIALYDNEKCLFEEVLRHSTPELAPFETINDQYEFRLNLVRRELEKHGVAPASLAAVVGRGGPLKPLASGTYAVSDQMVEELKYHARTEHASKLGGMLARGIADPVGIPAYIVDPISVDELEPLARFTGFPEIPRRSLFHALNLKAVAHRAARDHRLEYDQATFVMAHLGGGISVGVQKNGRMIDVTNPNDAGPFSPERAGTVSSGPFTDLCYSGKFTREQMHKRLVGGGGVVAHLGINDGREIEKRIEGGDEHAQLIYETMAYQVAKEIGAMAAVVGGNLDAIVLTGGLAYSKLLVPWITDRVSFIAPVWIYPGEDELQALVEGTLRVLRGEEPAHEYK